VRLLAQARHRVADWARARLRRSGYALERLPEHPPTGLEAHLRELVAAFPPGGKVLYAGTSRRILDHLLATGVAWTAEFPHSGTLALAILDFIPGQAVAWPKLASALGSQGRLLVRLSGTGGISLRTLEAAWEQAGLRMLDLAEYPRSSRPVDAIEPITVLLGPVTAAAPSGPAARRIDELRTWVGGPVGGWTVPRRLAGPGGGPGWDAVLNPGALSQAEGTLLVCRVEDATWPEMKVNEAVFMRRCPPRLLQLDARGDVRSTRAARWTAAPAADTHRLEDFRLVTHGGRILANHAILQLPAPARAGHPVDLNRIKTRVGFSELDPLRAELRFLGEPSLPRALGRTEKNWACFSTGPDLYLLYSPAPYRLYRCSDWDRLEFTGHSEADWILPGSSRDLPPLRNSINPVVYDRDHLLHIVHRVYPGKRYAYWPVLICRRTLRPVQASPQPLACGGWSGADGLLYLSAAVAGPEAIDLYFGAEDCATGHNQVSRRELDAAWQPVGTP
jgi:hypothetical protein